MSETATAAQPSGLAGYNMKKFAPSERRMIALRMVEVGARSAQWRCMCSGQGGAVFVGYCMPGRDLWLSCRAYLAQAGRYLCV
jgi:hypothetical protein